jgi:hypothetical protein
MAMPPAPVRASSLNTPPLRAAFGAKLEALKASARDWGVMPDHPEGAFISSMIGTQEGFAELALGLADQLHGIVDESRRLAQTELERQRTALRQAEAAVEHAKLASQRMEDEKQAVTRKLIAEVVPEMIKATKDAMIIRERRFNRNIEWGRALGTGALMVGLVLFGYVWGTWSDWGMSRRVETLGSAIRYCQDTSPWKDDKGNRLCDLRYFSPK